MRLWQHVNGKYYVTVRRGKHISLKTGDGNTARGIFNELKKEYLRGRLNLLESKSILLSAFRQKYLEIRRCQSANTIRADKLALAKLEEFIGNKALSTISQEKLDEFRTYLITAGRPVFDKKNGLIIERTGLGPNSCNTHIRHLKTALQKAFDWGYLKQPLKLKQFPKSKGKPIYMTPKEVKRLLLVSAKNPDLRVAIAIQIYCGCGRAEVISPITIGADTITYLRVKTLVRITVPIAEDLKPYINHLKPGTHRIVPWKDPSTYSKKFKKIAREANLSHITPHKLRHTFASHLLQHGEALKTISELLGHSNIQITSDFYAHLCEGQKRTAVNRLDYSDGDNDANNESDDQHSDID